jgi:hypothetical protein
LRYQNQFQHNFFPFLPKVYSVRISQHRINNFKIRIPERDLYLF